jgi:hypothetical protein
MRKNKPEGSSSKKKTSKRDELCISSHYKRMQERKKKGERSQGLFLDVAGKQNKRTCWHNTTSISAVFLEVI